MLIPFAGERARRERVGASEVEVASSFTLTVWEAVNVALEPSANVTTADPSLLT